LPRAVFNRVICPIGVEIREIKVKHQLKARAASRIMRGKKGKN